MNENFAVLFVIALNAKLFVLRRVYIDLFQSEADYFLVALTADLVSVAAILYLKRGKIFERKRLISAREALFFLLGAIGIAVLFKGIYYKLIGEVGSGGIVDPTLLALSPSDKSSIRNFTSMVEGPIKEEIIYRLGLLGSLAALIRKPSALILSSTFFAAMHYWVYPLSMMGPVFVTGLLLGVTYLTLGLPWAIAFHLILNLKAFYNDWLTGNDYGVIVIFTLLLFGIWRFGKTIVLDRKKIFGSDEASYIQRG